MRVHHAARTFHNIDKAISQRVRDNCALFSRIDTNVKMRQTPRPRRGEGGRPAIQTRRHEKWVGWFGGIFESSTFSLARVRAESPCLAMPFIIRTTFESFKSFGEVRVFGGENFSAKT